MTTPSAALPSLWLPVTSVPILLPSTTFADAFKKMKTPSAPLAEMTLAAPAVVPPTVFAMEPKVMRTPLPLLPSLTVPVTSVPILLPSITFSDGSPPVTFPILRLSGKLTYSV